MGRIFKNKYPIKKKGPDGHVLKDARGRPVYERDADGRLVYQESEHYFIEYTAADGKTKRTKSGKEAAVAKADLKKAEAEVVEEREGLPRQKLSEIRCLDMCRRYLDSQRRHVTEAHLENTRHRVEYMLREAHAPYLKDLTPGAIDTALAQLSAAGLADTTLREYLAAVKGMLNWAVLRREIPYNPIAAVRIDRRGGRARRRRALSEEEVGRLLAAGQDGPRRRYCRIWQNRQRKDGSYKAFTVPLAMEAKLAYEGANINTAYSLMIGAGLRLNEVASLTWDDVDLDGGTLQLRAEWTKNRKDETLPLAPSLHTTLKKWRRECREPERAVCKVTSRLLRYFNDDLAAAGIPKRIGGQRRQVAGKVRWVGSQTLDLHALRHTFGTRLNRAGADVKTIQTLMRHSTPTLTIGVYVHSDRARLQEAVESLPELAPAPLPQPSTEACRATGTDGKSVAPPDMQSAMRTTKSYATKSKEVAGSLKVRGSIPLTSTIQKLQPTRPRPGFLLG